MHAPEPIRFGSEDDLQGFREMLSELSKCSCTDGKSLAPCVDGGTSRVHHVMRWGDLETRLQNMFSKTNKCSTPVGRKRSLSMYADADGRPASVA